jgi:hypothetical protein
MKHAFHEVNVELPMRRKHASHTLAGLLLLLGAVGAAKPALAEGELLVTPTRVVFEGARRSAVISLVNTGKKPAVYHISFVRRRMTEEGKLQEVDVPAPDEQFAEDLIRYSPRELTLPPGVAQTIRMQLRKPSGLPSGEYRSHLLFRAIPASGAMTPSGEASQETASASHKGGITINLKAIYGVSIPIIVRHGNIKASVGITKLKLRPASGSAEPPLLSFTLTREGNQSIYGDVVTSFIPQGRREQVIGQFKGVALYTPNSQRLMQVPLDLPAGLELKQGRLRVTFKDSGKSETLADAELKVF